MILTWLLGYRLLSNRYKFPIYAKTALTSQAEPHHVLIVFENESGASEMHHHFSVISPWMFFCSMGRASMPWTSGSLPLCTRPPPRIAWRFVPCCWVTEPTPRWSTAMGRARWTWPRPLNSKRGSHVSLPFFFIKLTPITFGISTIFYIFKRIFFGSPRLHLSCQEEF